MGKNGKCSGVAQCVACKAPYSFLKANETEAFSHGTCAIECPDAIAKPKMPENALDLNGKEWPSACWNGTEEQHFFIIGILAYLAYCIVFLSMAKQDCHHAHLLYALFSLMDFVCMHWKTYVHRTFAIAI